MKCDVTFVNFPVPDVVRAVIANKIEYCVRKFSHKFATARASFSVAGHLHQVRLNISGSDLDMTVCASSHDLGHSIDQAIDKLEASLRKLAAKRHKKNHLKQSRPIEVIPEPHPKWQRMRYDFVENAFDRFEEEFAREFEDNVKMVG